MTSTSFSSIWKLVLAVNVILGLFLWIGLCTDYYWDSLLANICYPPLVAIIGTKTLLANPNALLKKQQWLKVVCCLPSIAGGLPYIILVLLVPFSCGLIAFLDDEMGFAQIQQAISPNTSKIAEVYFKPYTPLTAEYGRVEVYLKYKWLPFLRRGLYYDGYTHKDMRIYLIWRDEETICILGDYILEDYRQEEKVAPEKRVEIKVGLVKWKIPFVPPWLSFHPPATGC